MFLCSTRTAAFSVTSDMQGAEKTVPFSLDYYNHDYNFDTASNATAQTQVTHNSLSMEIPTGTIRPQGV